MWSGVKLVLSLWSLWKQGWVQEHAPLWCVGCKVMNIWSVSFRLQGWKQQVDLQVETASITLHPWQPRWSLETSDSWLGSVFRSRFEVNSKKAACWVATNLNSASFSELNFIFSEVGCQKCLIKCACGVFSRAHIVCKSSSSSQKSFLGSLSYFKVTAFYSKDISQILLGCLYSLPRSTFHSLCTIQPLLAVHLFLQQAL